MPILPILTGTPGGAYLNLVKTVVLVFEFYPALSGAGSHIKGLVLGY